MGITEETTYKIRKDYGKLPLSFIPNAGQVHEDAQYYIQGQGYGIYFTKNEVVYTFTKKATKQLSSIKKFPLHTEIDEEMDIVKEIHTLSLSFLGGNPHPVIEGQSEGTGKINYFRGNDPSKWHSNLSTFHEIIYRDLWPGIDLLFYGKNGQLKYDFIVQPGANFEVIQLAYHDADALSLDESGNLQIHTPVGILTDERPNSYQEKDGQQISISSSYVLGQNENGETSYGFTIGEDYDHSLPLIIDPSLNYSTYLGGDDGPSIGFGITIDTAGHAYVTGVTESTNFPRRNAIQNEFAGRFDAFVTKLSPDGTSLVFSTYLGGDNTDDSRGIAVDATGQIYVTGITNSTDFPIRNAFQEELKGEFNSFVTKLSPDGASLVFSTYLGGSSRDEGRRIAVDTAGNAYVTGRTNSTDFPTPNAFQPEIGGEFDAYVSKLSPDGALVFSTYLGGSNIEDANGIAVDTAGNAYVSGVTASTNFPRRNPFQAVIAGASDAFVTKLSPDGALIFSTYLGGSETDTGFGITVDTTGHAYVTGQTNSTDFPIQNAFQREIAGMADAFITKLSPDGASLVFSTYLGGNSTDNGFEIATDTAGNVYVTGGTSSTNFPRQNALQTELRGNLDAFLSKLSPDGTSLVFSTYLGGSDGDDSRGIAVDADENAYVTGFTRSPNFPTTPDAFQPDNPNSDFTNAFVAKINTVSVPTLTIVCSDNITVSVDSNSDGTIVEFPPPTVTPSGAAIPSCSPASGSFFPVGTTTVTCTATDAAGNTAQCSFTVTVTAEVGPIFIECPDDIKVFNDPGRNGAIVHFPAPDVSPGATASCFPPSGSFFRQGSTTVTCTATDAAGNTATCSFIVKVVIDPCRFFSGRCCE